jgi:hypothetical protein
MQEQRTSQAASLRKAVLREIFRLGILHEFISGQQSVGAAQRQAAEPTFQQAGWPVFAQIYRTSQLQLKAETVQFCTVAPR